MWVARRAPSTFTSSNPSADILGIVWTALGFVLQMLCWGMWSGHYTPFNIHCLKACATVISTLCQSLARNPTQYTSELSHRSL